MKKLFLGFLTFVLGFLNISTPLPVEQAMDENMENLAEVDHEGQKYAYALYEVKGLSRLSFFSNLPDKKSSSQLLERCDFLINGGFYGKDDKPIGWLVSEGQEISKYEANNLFNGLLYYDGEINLLRTFPETDVEWGVQTGPILISENSVQLLSIANDKHARRMVAGITQSGNLVFMAVWDRETVFGGPLLSDLPKVVIKIEPTIMSAINLDGGTASAFYSEATSLSEANPIGSYFCLN